MTGDLQSMNKFIVVTSVSAPNKALRMIAEGAMRHDFAFVVAGDVKSPGNFSLEGCRFLGIEDQLSAFGNFARKCPTGHYARKNLGYLTAFREGARCIIETDDDNLPMEEFFHPHGAAVEAPVIERCGWVNIYKFFTEELIWPRGLPLDSIHSILPRYEDLPVRRLFCPIQQGLVQGDPDVDAIYRLVMPTPGHFRSDRLVAIGGKSWCPFNSQNTTWYPQAYPLMYLPAYASFRMTDIWRSFVARAICRVNGWSILFDKPSAVQERNEHDLMRDFAEEVVGYLRNDSVMKRLDGLPLTAGTANLGNNMRMCYAALTDLGLIPQAETALVEAWLAECSQAGLLDDAEHDDHSTRVIP